METQAQDELKAHLLESDSHFRDLYDQHSDADEKLEKLEAKHAPTEEDQLEEIRLKKQKLVLKDEMTVIINRHRSRQVA